MRVLDAQPWFDFDHGEFKSGYKLLSSETDFILQSLFGSDKISCASSIDFLIRELEGWVKGNRNIAQQRVQIVNTSPSTTQGSHWVTAWIDPSSRRLVLFDPLPTFSLKARHLKKLRMVVDVETIATGHQRDGWSCGYISTWYQLNIYNAIIQKNKTLSPTFPLSNPPDNWNKLIWGLLKIKSKQDLLDSENALTLPCQFSCDVKKALDGAPFNCIELLTLLTSYYQGICVFLIDYIRC